MGMAGKSLKGGAGLGEARDYRLRTPDAAAYRKRNQTITATPKVPITKPTAM
jgi:hypothetical protein